MLTNNLICKTNREHYNKYSEMAKNKGIGIGSSKTYMGRTKEGWTELFIADHLLNNVSLAEFDSLYGWTGRGISLAENTCVHKHVIIYKVIGATPEFVI